MSTTASNKAIEVLEQGIVKIRQQAENEIAELQRTITNLRKAPDGSNNGGAPSPSPPPARASAVPQRSYRGMKKATALEVYMRDHRAAGRIPLAKIVADLLAGDADLGTPDRHERNIILAVKNKTRLYGYDENTREIWLTATADLESKPKPRRKNMRMSPRSASA